MNNYFLILISVLQVSSFLVFIIHREYALAFVQLFASLANLSMFFVRGNLR